MVIDIKESGKMVKRTALENISTTMELSMKGILQMEKKMDSAPYFLLMEREYRRIGNRLIFKEKEKFIIQMKIIFREIITCLKNMEKVYMYGKVKIANMMEISKKIFWKAKLNYIFQISNFILEK